MSQLNVDTIKNRLGTGGPTLSALTVTAGAIVGGALTVTGNLTVNGTQTIVNTQVLDVADKNIGITASQLKDAANYSSPPDFSKASEELGITEPASQAALAAMQAVS